MLHANVSVFIVSKFTASLVTILIVLHIKSNSCYFYHPVFIAYSQYRCYGLISCSFCRCGVEFGIGEDMGGNLRLDYIFLTSTLAMSHFNVLKKRWDRRMTTNNSEHRNYLTKPFFPP